MKNLSLILMLLFGIVISSCSPRVVTSRPNAADLSAYETFAYLPNAEVEVENSDFQKDKVNRSIINTVNSQMRQEGYSMDRENPDLLVLIATAKDTEVAVDTDPVYANYPYASGGINRVSPYYNDYYYSGYYDYPAIVGYDTDTYRYQEGTLVITLVDRASREIVWQGTTSDNIYDSTTTDEMVDLVRNVFDEYPIDNARK